MTGKKGTGGRKFSQQQQMHFASPMEEVQMRFEPVMDDPAELLQSLPQQTCKSAYITSDLNVNK